MSDRAAEVQREVRVLEEIIESGDMRAIAGRWLRQGKMTNEETADLIRAEARAAAVPLLIAKGFELARAYKLASGICVVRHGWKPGLIAITDSVSLIDGRSTPCGEWVRLDSGWRS